MKTVVAFANGRGGRIVFGVDDKTLNIVGMNPDTIFSDNGCYYKCYFR